AVQREQEFAQSLGRKLERAVQPVALGANFRERLVKTLASQPIESASARTESWFGRLRAWMPQTAAAAALLALTFFFVSRQQPKSEASNPKLPEHPIALEISYTSPTYTFRREDGFVVDTLSWHTNVVTETLWVQNQQSVKSQSP